MPATDGRRAGQGREVTDVVLVCGNCGLSFTWTAGEQEWYGRKGYARPKRCQTCREAKRAEEGRSDRPVEADKRDPRDADERAVRGRGDEVVGHIHRWWGD